MAFVHRGTTVCSFNLPFILLIKSNVIGSSHSLRIIFTKQWKSDTITIAHSATSDPPIKISTANSFGPLLSTGDPFSDP
jgi:hypothetical protein